jgi:aprataxin
MAALGVLREYAKLSDPTTLASEVLFAHTDTTLTIYDVFPKASRFEFLINLGL